MTIGMRTYLRIKQAEDKANGLGFKFKLATYSSRDSDRFVLVTDEETLPAYTPNAEMFSGNLDELESFLFGVEWARDYDHLLGLKTGERRGRAEQRLRNHQLLNAIEESGNKNADAQDSPF